MNNCSHSLIVEDVIRSMITEIKVVPRQGAEGVDLELAGDLARILHLCSTSSMQSAQAVGGAGRLSVSYEVSVVAGRRSDPNFTSIDSPDLNPILPDNWTTPVVTVLIRRD